MTRRSFISLVFEKKPNLDPAKMFASKYNEWITLWNKNPNTVDVKDYTLWPEVKKSWRKLEKEVDRLYRSVLG